MWGNTGGGRLLLTMALGFAAAIAALASANARDAREVAVSVGGQEVILVIDKDQCQLDRNHPSDSRVYDLVERGLAGQNELLLAAADCEQIGPWRSGQRPTLDDFTQVQVGLAYRSRDLTGREIETARGICSQLHKHGEALVSGPLSSVRDRFNQMSAEVKLNETRFIGVVREDPGACYASLVQRVRTDQGSDKLILSVFAHVVLRGRLIYIYRYTNGEAVASMYRLIDLVGEAVQAHFDANR